jgi:hypothetical protein
MPAFWRRLLLKSLWNTVYRFNTGVFDRVQTEVGINSLRKNHTSAPASPQAVSLTAVILEG